MIPEGWAALREAAKEFVAKVERGDARSQRSYAAFKDALAMLEASPPPPAIDDAVVERFLCAWFDEYRTDEAEAAGGYLGTSIGRLRADARAALSAAMKGE